MKIIDAALEQIEVGERRRRDYGDIGALAKGIKRVGLLEPIVVDRNGKTYHLVAGERRLKAVKLLKWKTIPAQLLENLTDAERRDIELEENENRKDLTAAERNRTFTASKKLVANSDKAADVRRANPPALGELKPGPKPKGGVSRAERARDLGTSEETLRRAEQHVETAEQYPFMQGMNWRQSDVLRMRERLEEIPATERTEAMGVLRCSPILDPELAVNLIGNMATKKPEERQEIYRLSQSDDPRNKSLALTTAAKLPPMPDPRLGIIDNASHILGAAIKPYPKDPLTPQFIEIRDHLKTLRAEVKKVSFDATKEQGGSIQ